MPYSSASERIDQLLTAYLQDYTAQPEPRNYTKRRWYGTRRRTSPQQRKARLISGVLAFALLGLSVGVWASPPIPQWGPGPSAEQVALQRELARAADLKRRLDAAVAELNQPDPNTYEAAKARADDLEHQLTIAEGKLRIPKAPISDAGQRARAEDLQRRLNVLNQLVSAPRPQVADSVALARARDLAAQNDVLEAELMRPRPLPDPLANVSASLTKDQILRGQKMFGLYTMQSPFNMAEVNLIQSEINRKANIVGYFQSWRTDFRPDAVKRAWLGGQIPLLTWESQPQVGSISADVPEYSLPRIIGGAYDDYIRRYARGIAELGLPLILRLDHEMNGRWYPWSEWNDGEGVSVNGNRKGDYVAMWRHVHDIFDEEGANAFVAWLWAPNRINAIPNQRPPKAFYPGDQYVDFVGMSGYYRRYDDAPTFTYTHGKTLPLLREASGGHKPILLAETGATEINGVKGKWIESLFRNLALPENGDIVGMVWFSLAVTNENEKGQMETNDWRIDSTPASARAMKAQLETSDWGLPLPASDPP